MDRVAEGFVWPFRDPEWLTKILIIGLIFLIPIAGPINGLGWMLATLDRLRAGEERMAPANLGHLERGLRLFVVQIGYVLVLVVIVLAIYLPGVVLAASQGKESANPAAIGLSIFLFFLSLGISTLGSLAVTFLTPSFVLETDHRGIRGGFDLGAVYRRSRANLTNTLIAGLMLIASGFISGAGAAVCFVGVVFTAAYALAVQAWILRCFEVGSQDVPQPRSSS